MVGQATGPATRNRSRLPNEKAAHGKRNPFRARQFYPDLPDHLASSQLADKAEAHAPDALTTPSVCRGLFFYFLLFSIGCSFLYNFVLHTFFGEMTARVIGWEDSPFQAEVGFASLGYAAVGFLACRRGFECAACGNCRTGAVSAWRGGPVTFIRSPRLTTFAPGNAGVILYTDFVIPFIGFALLWLQYRAEHVSRTRPARERKERRCFLLHSRLFQGPLPQSSFRRRRKCR